MQFGLEGEPWPSPGRDEEVQLLSRPVTQVVHLDIVPLLVLKQVAELEEVRGDEVLEARAL